MKNQRGVTLIALVVTIIVLIILAGVAIAALTGENGLITRSRESKKLQIEGEVRDRVILAVAAAKVAAENEATKNAGYLASANLGTSGLVYTTLTADLTSGLGYTLTPGTGKISVVYTTDDYKNATNDDEAEITCDITVSGNSFSIDNWDYTDMVS